MEYITDREVVLSRVPEGPLAAHIGAFAGSLREQEQIYLEATLAMKEKALAKTSPPLGRPGRFKAGDRLLVFLNSL